MTEQWFPTLGGQVCLLAGRVLGSVTYGTDSQGDPLVTACVPRDGWQQLVPCADEAGARGVVEGAG